MDRMFYKDFYLDTDLPNYCGLNPVIRRSSSFDEFSQFERVKVGWYSEEKGLVSLLEEDSGRHSTKILEKLIKDGLVSEVETSKLKYDHQMKKIVDVKTKWFVLLYKTKDCTFDKPTTRSKESLFGGKCVSDVEIKLAYREFSKLIVLQDINLVYNFGNIFQMGRTIKRLIQKSYMRKNEKSGSRQLEFYDLFGEPQIVDIPSYADILDYVVSIRLL